MRPVKLAVAKQQFRHGSKSFHRSLSSEASSTSDSVELGPLIKIKDATFYNEHPSSHRAAQGASNPPLFAGLTYKYPYTPRHRVGKPWPAKKHVAVIGTNPTPFLKVLKGDYISVPPNSRTYPYLSSDEIAEADPRLRVLSQAIQYVGFTNTAGGGNSSAGGVQGAYLSARYESRREETDWTVEQYLKGQTELNPSEQPLRKTADKELFRNVVRNLRLEKLLHMPVSNLSNGQTRRSRIAKALLNEPELLLLDEPFMGLDPPTLVTLSPILREIASRSSPSLILGLRPQDPIPDWITDVVVLGQRNTVICQKSLVDALYDVYSWNQVEHGHDKADLSVRTAKALTDACGPPPFGVANILTSHGIHQFQAVKDAWRMMNKGKQSDGLPLQKGSNQNQQEDSLSISAHKTENSGLIGFSSGLSTDAVQILQAGLKAPQQPVLSEAKAKGKSERDSLNRATPNESSEPLIDLTNIVVKYGTKVVLGHPPPQPGHKQPGLNLKISRGSRLLLLGPNGSGKTTLLSLLTSDHPQSYSLPIKFFGRTRLPSPGIPGLSLWEIQSRIGHSSPEVHAFFPKNTTTRQVLESAWAETFSSKPVLNDQRAAMVDHFLRTFEPELRQLPVAEEEGSLAWASDRTTHPLFGRLPFGAQRLLLLLRAIIKQPDIIILDEGFSGMSAPIRDKALAWLERGDHAIGSERSSGGGVVFPGLTDQQALVVVSHVREEVPSCITEYVRLPSEEEATEQGKGVEIGKSEVTSERGWNMVWGL